MAPHPSIAVQVQWQSLTGDIGGQDNIGAVTVRSLTADREGYAAPSAKRAQSPSPLASLTIKVCREQRPNLRSEVWRSVFHFGPRRAEMAQAPLRSGNPISCRQLIARSSPKRSNRFLRGSTARFPLPGGWWGGHAVLVISGHNIEPRYHPRTVSIRLNRRCSTAPARFARCSGQNGATL